MSTEDKVKTIFDQTKRLSKTSENQWSSILKHLRFCEMRYFMVYLRVIIYGIIFVLLCISIVFHPFHFFSKDILYAERFTTLGNILAISILFSIVLIDLVRDCCWRSRVLFYGSSFGLLSLAVVVYAFNYLFVSAPEMGHTTGFTIETAVLGAYALAAGIIFSARDTL